MNPDLPCVHEVAGTPPVATAAGTTGRFDTHLRLLGLDAVELLQHYPSAIVGKDALVLALRQTPYLRVLLFGQHQHQARVEALLWSAEKDTVSSMCINGALLKVGAAHLATSAHWHGDLISGYLHKCATVGSNKGIFLHWPEESKQHPSHWRKQNPQITYQARETQPRLEASLFQASAHIANNSRLLNTIRQNQRQTWRENLEAMASTWLTDPDYVTAEEVKHQSKLFFDNAKLTQWDEIVAGIEERAKARQQSAGACKRKLSQAVTLPELPGPGQKRLKPPRRVDVDDDDEPEWCTAEIEQIADQYMQL